MPAYTITWESGGLVLPPAGAGTRGQLLSTWGQEVGLELLIDHLLARPAVPGQGMVVELTLVHREDNQYNSRAIAAALPARFGGTRIDRHLGYLTEAYLRALGYEQLPALAHLAGDHNTEVVCTGELIADDDIVVQLPPPELLRKAIARFFTGQGLDKPSTPDQAGATPRADRRHTQDVHATREALDQVSSFTHPGVALTRLEVRVARDGRGRGRSLNLFDADSGRSLGEVRAGHLLLDDERDRADVLTRLDELGIPVVAPKPPPPDLEDPAWTAESVPNMWTYWFPDGLDLRPRDPNTTNSWTTMAVYNPTTKVLWVEDSRLLAPVRIYAARLGLEVTAIGLPRRPWGLGEEISWRSLKDPDLRPEDRYQTVFDVELLTSVRDLVPEDLFLTTEVSWLARPRQQPRRETEAQFRIHERYVAQRGRLFLEHALTGAIAECRLCGQPGLEFTTPVCAAALTYCHACLDNAATGPVRDRGAAARALKRLGEVEFDDTPMLEAQLDTLHVNPQAPAFAARIDEMLLLRFAVARRQYPWSLLLEEAGFAEHGLRTGRGTLVRARDGHLCLSLGERVVCDFLHQHGIDHEREPRYPIDADYNPTGLRRADWRLGDGTLVELWGMPKDPAYAAKMNAKRQLAARHQLGLVELVAADLTRLAQSFAAWLPKGVKGDAWSWTPLVPAPPRVRREPRGDARGRNDANVAARKERLRRCRQAVELQSQGLSRSEIASTLTVSLELVKALLRDGKFYSNPATDPARTHLAEKAAEARRSRTTRSQFQTAEGLSSPKVQEAWRDADVLYPEESAWGMAATLVETIAVS